VGRARFLVTRGPCYERGPLEFVVIGLSNGNVMVAQVDAVATFAR
jgi:hypothetical protein